MNLIVKKTEHLRGDVNAPPSKSHTHRAVILASLASGTSTIENPLLCEDCLATIEACRAIGAEIKVDNNLTIGGVDGEPQTPRSTINVKNSGTTLRIMAGVTALCEGTTTIDGDESIRQRPIGPLLKALNELGATARSLENEGYPPVEVTGKLKGGKTILEGTSSQYLSALLIACPFANLDTVIRVTKLISKPYVKLTLEHLKRTGIKIRHTNLSEFRIDGNQKIKAFKYRVPGDYSSAAFLLAAASITDSRIRISNLYPDDEQGDKAIGDILVKMKTGSRREIDLSDTPDLLPITAVLGCFAKGITVIKNVKHARLKESDRITSICLELKKMNANIVEQEDGLIVRKSSLKGARLNGHRDHRIVMALAVAGLGAEGETIISDVEAILVSYPGFVKTLKKIGADICLEEK